MASSSYILRDSNRVSPTKHGKHGYGGNHRTRQLADLVDQAGFEIVDVPDTVETTRWERYYHGLRCWWAYSEYETAYADETLPSPTGHRFLRYAKTFEAHPEAAFLLQEEPHFSAYHAAREAGLPVVAAPHNLETIHRGGSPDVLKGTGPAYSLLNEVKHLALSDLAVCISREEQWLLNNCGVTTDFLPYYPPDEKAQSLRGVADRRRSTSPRDNRYLVLGSVHNQPAYQGVLEQLRLLQRIWQDRRSFHVDVAGYGTDRIREDLDLGDGFQIHGTVSPDHLHDLQTATTAQLIHQSYGLGALTRVPEALIAGIPVLANAHAARSAYDLDGVYVYQDGPELADLIGQSLPPPSPLQRPGEAEERFIRRVRSLAGRSTTVSAES